MPDQTTAGAIRTFSTGATRDQDATKPDYEGFLSPAVMQRFAAYMSRNRIQSDGNTRASDNWQKGIPPDAYMKSLMRHVFDAWALHRGLRGEATQDIDDALCGVLFNAMGYMFESLRAPPVDRKDRIYIAGPMRGIAMYNFPAFDAARDKLRAQGWDPINPADLDRSIGFDPLALPADWDWTQIPPGFDFALCRKRDIEALETCAAIYMLPGWERSKGARAERAHAEWAGMRVMEPQGVDLRVGGVDGVW